MNPAPVVIGLDVAATQLLTSALAADSIVLPDPASLGARSIVPGDLLPAEAGDLDRVVVATWSSEYPCTPLVAIDDDEWRSTVGDTLAFWFEVLAAVTERCSDDAAVVVVVERPAPIDSWGHSRTVTVAEGLAALTRSLALIHGSRGVRVNLLASQSFTAPDRVLGLQPPLDTFPGSVIREIAGGAAILLTDEACGVSGSVVRADCGRSW